MRLTTDLFAYCARAAAALEHDLDLRLPHPRGGLDRGAGARLHARERDRLLRRRRSTRGSRRTTFGARLSFFFNAHNHFFQEVAKFRAARRLWARDHARPLRRDEPEGAGAALPRADRRLDADGAAAGEQRRARHGPGALGGLRRRAVDPHERRSTRRSRCRPSARRGSRCARSRSSRTRPAATDTADPLGGSYFVEALTDELEAARARADRADRRARRRGRRDRAGLRPARDRGGGVPLRSSEVEAGERVIVGVNRFAEDEAEQIELHRLDPEAERRQLRARRRACGRSGTRARPQTALAEVRAAARGRREPAPADARGARGCPCTVGEICARSCDVGHVDAQRTTRSVQPTLRVRILLVSQMYPGRTTPTSASFVAQIERALAERGHEIERAVLDRAAAARRRYSQLARRDVARGRRFRPDVVYAHFLVPAGLLAAVAPRRAARRHRARPGRPQRRRDPRRRVARHARTVRRAASVIAVSDYLRRELEAKVPEARGKTRGDRLRASTSSASRRRRARPAVGGRRRASSASAR